MQNFRIGLYWKIFLTILAGMLLSALVITILYRGFQPRIEAHPDFKEMLIARTELLAGDIARQLQTSAQPLEKIAREIHSTRTSNIQIFDVNGSIVVSCLEKRLTPANVIERGLVEKTFQNGFDFDIVYPRFVMTPVVSVPLRVDNATSFVLQCSYPITKELKNILPRGLPEIVVFIMLGGFTGFLSRYLTRPIRELTRAARKMGQGSFGDTVKIRSHDEVGELARTFNEMSERLAEFQRSRRELFADISHELRSPLARMLTDAEILIDREMERQEREQHLKSICSEIDNMNHLIGDLAILSRLDQDGVSIAMRRYLLQDVISQAVALFMLPIEEKGITLKQHISGDVPPVSIDPKRIGQVISNILTNALRYTPHGGTIEIGLRRQGDFAEVWIRDTGEGIPEDKLPFIFERFYRVDKSRSRTTGGSGLGLAIAKKFIESHRGAIRAESRPGQGTCIYFTIPIAV